jgi:hypothetical protein
MTPSKITDQEIENCGWSKTIIRVDKEVLYKVPEDVVEAGDGDVLIDGWQYTKDNNEWWELCRNGRRILIIHKWYVNEVGQEWDVVLDIPIDTEKELLMEMGWLNIKQNGKED